MDDADDPMQYWDGEIREARSGGSDALWYRYMAGVYRDLVGAGPGAAGLPSLKTDLYEEARGVEAPLRHLPAPRYGVDVSPAVVAAARRNMERAGVACALAVADVRRLPFADGRFGLVLSGSTLDHFDTPGEIVRSVRELARVLAPEGRLVMTLDNPHNPVLWLRRHVSALSRRRLRPYFVGETLSRSEGEAVLLGAGLRPGPTRAVAHAPRDPAMRLARRWQDDPVRAGRLLASLGRLERLEALPTRWRTGYYLAFDAIRPAAEPAEVPREAVEQPSPDWRPALAAGLF